MDTTKNHIERMFHRIKMKRSYRTNTPIYLHLYNKIRADIIKNAYPYGSKLPSKRAAANLYGVSIITVEHAYTLLAEEGYILSKERSGYYVSYREQDIFSTAEYADQTETTPSHSPSLVQEAFPGSVYAKAVRHVLSEYGDRVLIKSENFGLPELRDAIAKYLMRARGIEVEPSQIIVGSGAEYIYNLIVVLLGRTQMYAIETPSYEKIEQIYRTHGIQYEKLPLGKDGIDSAALSHSQANVLHVTPYRSFPSGVTATAAKKREYLRWAKHQHATIIEDDFESEFYLYRKPIETLFAMEQDGNVIYLNTFSKTIASAMRMGYMVLPKGILTEAQEKIGFFSCTVPTLEQYVLAELINNGDFERHLNRVRRQRKKQKEKAGKAKSTM